MASTPKTQTPMLGYSYIRWSSEGQSLGDSQRRQLTLADAWAKRHGIILDTSTYQDHGISAFKGANLVEGKLGAFLEAIDERRIKTPCYLLVEALDRITRTEIDVALELFLSIIKRGVTIVTLQNEQEFSKESIKKDRGISLIIAISMLVQGHEDSAKRAMRVKAAFDAKKARGEKKITKVPTWLTPLPDRKNFDIDSMKASLINRMFDMTIAGRGQRDIARILNDEKVPTLQWAKKWDQGAVANVLNNHAVYGRKDRTKEDDYWKPIMSKEKFMAAQDAMRGRKWKGANREGTPNLFAGLAFCGVCGSRMRYIPSATGYPYMKCTRAVDDKTCRGKLFPYEPCEVGFLYTAMKRDRIAPSGKFLEREAHKAPAIQGEIDSLKKRQRKLVKLAMDDEGDEIEAVQSELKALQKQIRGLEDQLAALDKNPITDTEIDGHTYLVERYFNLRLLAEVNKAKGQPQLADLRRQVKVSMARLFKRIEFGIGKDGWEPQLHVTLKDDRIIMVDVTKFMTNNSLKRQSNPGKVGKRTNNGRKAA